MDFQLVGPDLSVEEEDTELRLDGGDQVVPEPVINVNNRADSDDNQQVVPQASDRLSILVFPESMHLVQESFALAAADQVDLMMIRASQDPGPQNEQQVPENEELPPPSSIQTPSVQQLQPLPLVQFHDTGVQPRGDVDDQVVPQHD